MSRLVIAALVMFTCVSVTQAQVTFGVIAPTVPLPDPNSPGTLACWAGDNYGLACMTCVGGSRDGELCLGSNDCPGGGSCQPNNALCPGASCGGTITGPAPPITLPYPKSRYVGFFANTDDTWVGKQVAVRVKLKAIDGHTECTDQVRWVGPPGEICEGPVCTVTFFGSQLQSTPHFMDWTTLNPAVSGGAVQIYGEEIIPNSLYGIQAIDISQQGNIGVEANYSSPALLIKSAKWGDVIKPLFPFTAAAQPSIADVLSLVNKWLGALDPSKARSQLQPVVLYPPISINLRDVLYDVDAWLGVPYPFVPSCTP